MIGGIKITEIFFYFFFPWKYYLAIVRHLVYHLVGPSTLNMGAQGGPNLSRSPKNGQVWRARNQFSNGFDINFLCYDSQLGVIQYSLKLSHFLMASPFNIVLVDFDKYGNALKKWLSFSLSDRPIDNIINFKK